MTPLACVVERRAHRIDPGLRAHHLRIVHWPWRRPKVDQPRRDLLRLPGILEEGEGIAMALETKRNARASDEVRELIEARLKAGHDWATQVEAAENRGFERGIAEVARRMRDQGFDEEAVQKATGLQFRDL